MNSVESQLDRLRPVTVPAALGICALAWWGALTARLHDDFDLYWFGGLAERMGSYTTTGLAQRLATAHHVVIPQGGVYGSAVLVGLVFQPLTFLGLRAANHLWMAASALAIVLALRYAAPSVWPAWLLLGGALMWGTDHALQLGQASVFTFALVIVAYRAIVDGKDEIGGAALGVAIALKLYPAFLVVPLIAHRRWRALGVTVGTAAVLFLVTVPALGLHDSVQAARFSAHLSGQVDSWIHNQSVPGLIVRATRDQTTARWVSRGLVVAFAALLIARPRRNIRLTFALAVAAMLLSQPISWEFYFPLTIVMVMALAEEGAPRATWVVAGIAYVVIAYPFLYVQGNAVSGAGALLYCPRLFGTALLAGTVWWASRAGADHRGGARAAQVRSD